MVLLTCVLLIVPDAAAQTEGDPWAPSTRRISLAPQRTGPPPQVRISPGVGTLILFDSPVARVELAGRERFARVRLDADTLTLLPLPGLDAGEELRLTVYFADGAVPTSADFLLVVNATLAERQVEVFRHPRSATALQAELEERGVEVRRLRDDVARLQAAQALPEGLAGLLATGLMDKNGVQARPLRAEVVLHSSSALTVRDAVTFRAARSIAFKAQFANVRAAEAWMAEGAALQAKDGTALRVLRVWQAAPIPPGEAGPLVVEAEATATLSSGPYTLTVWAAGHKRSVILGNIHFP
ncbi:DUF2381 family protein [Pyxidicoccus parkwayensis]|uniref:DUF2381 family protein n=1 Tax=Pyxidicoccus parkwayensis TaxID=2813578 RepID=A0ABX7P069_9BACT|nr:DUF2381 family protein [Pyxidicoccus parkwaysis]QSQ23080.1 DUF2381 family protein [Pyxidicoccus parkwaysis]